MALGNMQAWAQHNQQKEDAFSYAYWTSKASDVRGNIGQIDVTNKTLAGPQHTLLPASQMWNEYLKAAQSRGIKPNYAAFRENYTKLKAQDDAQFLNMFTSAQMRGLKPKDIRKAINADPKMKQKLINAMMNTNDPELQAQIASLLQEEKSLRDKISENPLPYLAGGAGAYWGLKKFGPKIAGFKPGLGTAALLLGSGGMASDMLEGAGLSESEANLIGRGGVGALSAYLGRDAFRALTPEGFKALRREANVYQRGGKATQFTPVTGYDDLRGQKIPADIKRRLNEHRKNLKGSAGTKLKANAKFSTTSLAQAKTLNISPRNIARTAKLPKKFTMPKGRAGAALMAANALYQLYALASGK
jgi:hypothetical protein